MNRRYLQIPVWWLVLIVSTVKPWAHSAIRPVPRSDQFWQERQKTLNQRVVEGGAEAQVLFLGDSITQGWEGAGKEAWVRFYEHRRAINLGIGGDRTQHVLWRLENGNLEGVNPKAVVLMIGTNNSNGDDNSVEQISDGVRAIVLKLRERLPNAKILLLAIFPRGENPQSQRGKILQVNQILQKLGDGQHVFFVDFGHKFLDERGFIPAELMPDFLHLSPKGYEIWAESVEDLLSRILGDRPVGPAAATNLTGEWIWTMRGPDGNPIEAGLVLQQEGSVVTGKFARGPDRWLEIGDGQATDDGFSWTVTRDRPDGGAMVYRMTGKLANGQIVGTVKTELDGQTTTSEWSARRK
jgi:beta-glucosidase